MINFMKKHMNKGFTLLESIFSLFIVSLSLSLLFTALPLLKKINEFDVSIEEEIALAKIRETLLFASDILDIRLDKLSIFNYEYLIHNL